MKIAVSACLLGINCKYNGGNNYSKKVVALACDNEIIPGEGVFARLLRENNIRTVDVSDL